MTPANRLRTLQMCIARHDMLDFLLRARGDDLQEGDEVLFELRELVSQPQSHIRSHLIVPTPTCVKFASDPSAYDFSQTTFIGGVDVFVNTGDDFEGIGLPFLEDLLEAFLDGSKLFLGEEAHFCVGAGERDATPDVLRVEGAVKVDGFVVLGHDGVGAAGEATTPEFASGGGVGGHVVVYFLSSDALMRCFVVVMVVVWESKGEGGRVNVSMLVVAAF